MARTAAGATITETHRQGQLRIRALALRDFTRLWPLWQGDEPTFQNLLQASMPLVRGYHALSSSLAAGYYQQFRLAEHADGQATPRLAKPLDEQIVLGTLHLTGADMTRQAIQAGQDAQAAMQTALIRTSGTVTRFALAGGRDTLTQSVADDKAARGWARVTSGAPCAFCALLASRGVVFHAEDTAGFEAHDHCSCSAEPQYDGAQLPGRGEEFRSLYQEAVSGARGSGDLERGTSNDALNAFRRHLSRQ